MASLVELAVIGGSGFYEIPGLTDVEEVAVETPFGAPSDAIRIGTLEGARVAFLARHGRRHSLLPSELPQRANFWALKSLGVRRVLAVSAVGSLRAEFARTMTTSGTGTDYRSSELAGPRSENCIFRLGPNSKQDQLNKSRPSAFHGRSGRQLGPRLSRCLAIASRHVQKRDQVASRLEVRDGGRWVRRDHGILVAIASGEKDHWSV